MENYKKYSLGQLENWVHDAFSSSEVEPEEIYGTIKSVIEEQYYYHKHHASRAYELLALLNGNGIGHIKEYGGGILSCDKDDPSPECRDAWNSFWTHEREAECHQMKHKDVTWRLPVEVDGSSGEYYINLPDDLLELVNLKEGDEVKWIDNGDGSFILQKYELDKHTELPKHSQSTDTCYKTYGEAIKDGWTMTDDGFWVRDKF